MQSVWLAGKNNFTVIQLKLLYNWLSMSTPGWNYEYNESKFKVEHGTNWVDWTWVNFDDDWVDIVMWRQADCIFKQIAYDSYIVYY